MSIPRVGVLMRYSKPNEEPEYLCVFQEASKLWGFPKGRLKNFESHTQGACRELLEETGCKLSSNLLSYDHMIHIKRGKHHHYYFVRDIVCKPVVTVDGFEIIDHKWMTLEELSTKSVSYFTDQVIKKIKMEVPIENPKRVSPIHIEKIQSLIDIVN